MRDFHSSSSISAKLLLLALAAFALSLGPTNAGPREDLRSFLLGEKATWDSTGHPKAAVLRIKLSYPKDWAAEEASRPHIVQQFTSESGRGLEMFMVQIRPLPPPLDRDLTKKEKQIVSDELVDGMLSADGFRLVSRSTTQLDGEDCEMLEMEHVGERAGMKIGQKMLSFVVPRKGAVLILQGSVGGDAANGFAEIDQRYNEAKSLLQQIAASCVLTDKWLPKKSD